MATRLKDALEAPLAGWRVDGVRRDPVLVRRVLQSLARNVATEAAVSVIAADAGGSSD